MSGHFLSASGSFMRHVMPEPNSGCWLWDGAVFVRKDRRIPYGKAVVGRKQMAAHRRSWQLFRGEIPAGLYVCHKCDIPLCVNPDHLFLGTQFDNMADMIAKGRDTNKRATLRAQRSGDGCPTRKLSSADVREIRKLATPGTLSHRSIGAQFGVSQTQISRIIRGVRWGSVA